MHVLEMFFVIEETGFFYESSYIYFGMSNDYWLSLKKSRNSQTMKQN